MAGKTVRRPRACSFASGSSAGFQWSRWSERKAGKVKRIRNSGRVEVQACDFRGQKTHGAVATGQARLLDAEATERVRKAIARKYGVVGRVTMFFSKLRGPADRTVGIAVKLDG